MPIDFSLAAISGPLHQFIDFPKTTYYLYENGIHDEEDLIELALLADGKRYDPTTGTFV